MNRYAPEAAIAAPSATGNAPGRRSSPGILSLAP
jgi:hypothetical protein